MNGLIIVWSFCCVVFVFGENSDPKDFEVDYFFSQQRTRDAVSKCDSDNFKHECGLKCGGPFTCAFEKCFCLQPPKHSKRPETPKINTKIHDIIIVRGSDDLNNGVEKIKSVHQGPIYSLPSERRPISRHHIAHFCENLGKARKCIRTCMKLGKPAFCGKDHVCYCGHKYDDHHKDPVVDPDNMYAQFQDLYAKYFGSTDKSIQDGDIVTLAY